MVHCFAAGCTHQSCESRGTDSQIMLGKGKIKPMNTETFWLQSIKNGK